MNFGNFAQAAAKIFSSFEKGTIDTGAPKRFTDQMSQWVGHFSRSAIESWVPNLMDPVLCSFCEEDAVTDCIVCGEPACMAHAHISHRAEIICDECVAEALKTRGKKPRRKRREQAPQQQRQPGIPPAVIAAFQTLGVTPEASFDEVAAAFKSAAVANHPDKFSGLQKEQAEARMKNINASFALLKDFYKRKGDR
jgi:hypothetical protein